MRPPWESPIYGPVTVPLGATVTLTNVGAAYDAILASQGLGFADVDMTNVVSITVNVRVSKVGTGNQDWQLWNETDGTQVGVVTDSGAAGTRVLTFTVNNINLAGVKRLRMRARSSVAADDPVYLGACLQLN